jgi:hypothetical protein
VAGSCVHTNKILVSIKMVQGFLDSWAECVLLKKDYAQWSQLKILKLNVRKRTEISFYKALVLG